ncbi:MAG: exodeoxyribonuclease VII large subunit [Bacteroidales bacterium]|nr:exodeoxyribonuclease VII large subunit [Bacteroidales bacterium]
MSEVIKEKTVFTLLEVTESIRHTLNERYQSSFWVKAEMNKLNYYVHSGHCYPDLLEKREGKMVAQIRATLWKDDYIRINDHFLKVLKEPLRNGINILFNARISFDPVHGLSLRILDIDPSWSLGELEREKQASVERLRKEGLFSRNKSLLLPLLPQRIAVISVESSKGYADFLQLTGQNPWGYCFFHMLFPSFLQGEKVAPSIIQQLERIEKVKDHFDVVAIIRGGGGDVGLSGYNQYELARAIACFSLPVITGIGHATNETVTEMVAFMNCITPTELGNFLIQRFHDFLLPVREGQRRIKESAIQQLGSIKKEMDQTASGFMAYARELMSITKHELFSQAGSMKSHTGFYLRGARENLFYFSGLLKKRSKVRLDRSGLGITDLLSGLKHHLARLLTSRQKDIEMNDRHVSMLDPKNILARGFSITLHQGKAVRSMADIQPEDLLTTVLFDGTVKSVVTGVNAEGSSDPV